MCKGPSFAAASQYKIALGDNHTVTRDGDVAPYETVGPLVWKTTQDGKQKVLCNAMNNSSFKYESLDMCPGAIFSTWLETQTDNVVRSNVVHYSGPKPPSALNPKKWVEFPLESRVDINHNTRRLRFKLPVKDLGLPVGQHIFLKATVDGSNVMRAYTPVGYGPYYVEFVIKVYFPLPPKFPNGGILTQHMDKLQVGDTLGFKGPLGHYDFDCRPFPLPRDTLCSFTNEGTPAQYRHLGLIAGGSGITPCLQVATELLKLDRDVTVSLLYANQTPDDILCDEEIAAIEKDPRVRVWYTVDRAPADWKYSVGFIDEAMCRDRLPPPSEHTYIFMCGPPPMLKFACRPNLEKLGHADERVLGF